MVSFLSTTPRGHVATAELLVYVMNGSLPTPNYSRSFLLPAVLAGMIFKNANSILKILRLHKKFQGVRQHCIDH